MIVIRKEESFKFNSKLLRLTRLPIPASPMYLEKHQASIPMGLSAESISSIMCHSNPFSASTSCL